MLSSHLLTLSWKRFLLLVSGPPATWSPPSSHLPGASPLPEMNSKCGGLSPRLLMPLLSLGDLHQISSTVCTSSSASLSASHTSAQNPTFHCHSASFRHRSTGSPLNTSKARPLVLPLRKPTSSLLTHHSKWTKLNSQLGMFLFSPSLRFPPIYQQEPPTVSSKWYPDTFWLLYSLFPSWDMSPWRQGPYLGPNWVPGSAYGRGYILFTEE